MPPLILVTNDDGIESPGLKAAAEAAADLGDLLIVAPREQQSAMGRSYPMDDTSMGQIEEVVLNINGKEMTGYGVSGSPAQAVAVGVLTIAERRPDLCISGINYGENIGMMVSASGTVGAALGAHIGGIPSLAMSLALDDLNTWRDNPDVNWEAPKHFTRHFAAQILEEGLPPEIAVINVNVPVTATRDTPARLTTMSSQHYLELKTATLDGQTRPQIVGFKVVIDEDTLEESSDIRAVIFDHVVSVTPLGWDWTADTDWGSEYR